MTNKTHSSINFIFCLVLVLLSRSGAFAQPVVPPSLPDNNIIYNCGEGFGTAMINYGTTTLSPATNVIFGAAWESSCLASLITVTDVGTGSVATCMPSGLPPGSLWSYSSIPDVAIGNAATPGNFVMAVAYSVGLPGPATGIIVDFYDITGAGGPLAVTFNSSVLVATLPWYQNDDVHIDIIAAHNSTPGLLPICQKFGLSFEDQVSGNLFVAYGDVSTYTVGPPCPLAHGTQMDVAAIQRNVAPVGPPIVHDYALLTWVSPVGNIMYGEYDLTTMTCAFVPGTVLIEEVLGAPYVSFITPRIDGDDDYTTNSPTGTTVVYEAAYEANYSFCLGTPYANSATIHTFNNLISAYDPTLGLPASLSGVGSFSPVTVEAGGGCNDGGVAGFDVFHWAGGFYTSSCPGMQGGAMVMEPININTGMMAPNPYYEVSTGISPFLVGPNIYDNLVYVWHGGEWTVCASSTCNTASTAGSLILYAWVQLGVIGSGAPQGAMYKLTSPCPYSFRQANPITGTIGVSQKLSLSPNPSNGTFSIAATVPTDKATDEATIDIIDMLGNTVFTDKTPVINGAFNMQVNLGSNLANGMYMARLKCASSTQVTRFTLDR